MATPLLQCLPLARSIPTAIASSPGLVASLGAIALASSWAGGMPPSLAQAEGLAACAPPQAGEYLLLVVVPDAAARSKLDQALPPSVKAPTCDYLGSTVARMGGFRKPEDADAWATYLRDVAALPAFVAQPAAGINAIAPQPPAAQSPATQSPATQSPATQSPAAQTSVQQSPVPQVTVPQITVPEPSVPQVTVSESAIPQPAIAPQPLPAATPGTVQDPAAVANAPLPSAIPSPLASSTPSPVTPLPTPVFAPRTLAGRQVVLVDYANQTAIAHQVRQLTQLPVGLASHNQRPYLVATITPESSVAEATLQQLSASGLPVLLVDGSQVTLLTPAVQAP